ncbi:hypothetical protein MRB53_038084 [Persea americana]|nr:hypothetical protein MRB53_038084 [Persea americana]
MAHRTKRLRRAAGSDRDVETLSRRRGDAGQGQQMSEWWCMGLGSALAAPRARLHLLRRRALIPLWPTRVPCRALRVCRGTSQPAVSTGPRGNRDRGAAGTPSPIQPQRKPITSSPISSPSDPYRLILASDSSSPSHIAIHIDIIRSSTHHHPSRPSPPRPCYAHHRRRRCPGPLRSKHQPTNSLSSPPASHPPTPIPRRWSTSLVAVCSSHSGAASLTSPPPQRDTVLPNRPNDYMSLYYAPLTPGLSSSILPASNSSSCLNVSHSHSFIHYSSHAPALAHPILRACVRCVFRPRGADYASCKTITSSISHQLFRPGCAVIALRPRNGDEVICYVFAEKFQSVAVQSISLTGLTPDARMDPDFASRCREDMSEWACHYARRAPLRSASQDAGIWLVPEGAVVRPGGHGRHSCDEGLVLRHWGAGGKETSRHERTPRRRGDLADPRMSCGDIQ